MLAEGRWGFGSAARGCEAVRGGSLARGELRGGKSGRGGRTNGEGGIVGDVGWWIRFDGGDKV